MKKAVILVVFSAAIITNHKNVGRFQFLCSKRSPPPKKEHPEKSDVEELVSLTAPRSRVAPCSKQEKKKTEKTVVTNSCFSIFTHTTKLQPYMG